MEAPSKATKRAVWRVLPAMAALAIASLIAMMVFQAHASDDDALLAGAVSAGQGQENVVVALVNDKPITEAALQKRIYSIENSPQPGADKPDNVRQVALDRLIREEVLLVAADSMGLSAGEAGAREFARTQAQTILTSDDPNVTKGLELSAQGIGVTPEDFANDPRVIETYQRFLTLGALYNSVREQLPVESRTDELTFQAALDQLAAKYRADITIVILRP